MEKTPSILEKEKINQSILEHIVLGVAHEINNPNAFVRLNVMNIKKMFNLLRPCLDEYSENHPDEKFGPYSLMELRSKLSQLLESTIGATVRIITIADKLKQCTSFALSQSNHFSIITTLKNVIDMHRFLIEKWANLELVYNEANDFIVLGHTLQMEQAFSILLTNACDAISEKSRNVKGFEKGNLKIIVNREGQEILVTFKDDGCGIAEEHLEKIFAPYFTTKPQGAGDGMGLALCQAIIDRHEGRMKVESKKGLGTEMTVVLPAKASPVVVS